MMAIVKPTNPAARSTVVIAMGAVLLNSCTKADECHLAMGTRIG